MEKKTSEAGGDGEKGANCFSPRGKKKSSLACEQ